MMLLALWVGIEHTGCFVFFLELAYGLQCGLTSLTLGLPHLLLDPLFPQVSPNLLR
jgi:hypothetical protein